MTTYNTDTTVNPMVELLLTVVQIYMWSFYEFFFQQPIIMYDVCMVITYSKSMDQPGKVANPARGQLNRENEQFLVPIRA